MQRSVLLLLLLLASTGCRSLGTPIAAPHTTTPWLTLQYGPGMIGPPPWRALITEDGEVSLIVEERVDRQRLSPRDIASLRALLREWERLDPAYTAEVSDQETLRITYGGREVVVYGPHILCDRAPVQQFLNVWNAAVRALEVPRVGEIDALYEECQNTRHQGAARMPGASHSTSVPVWSSSAVRD